MAAARAYGFKAQTRRELWKPMVVLSILSAFPDADAIGFLVGIPYEHPWGHRGATHSLMFGVIFGALAFGWAKLRKVRPWKPALFVAAVVASHGVLDAFTDGGLGCALLWPFTLERYFAPWTPIPVAPIGKYMFSARGLFVLTYELILFSPFLFFAFFPPRKAKAPQSP